MQTSRRDLLISVVALSANAIADRHAFGQATDSGPPLPRPELFQSGDFVWPKRPGSYVPYNSGSQTNVSNDEQRWLTERRQFLARVRRTPGYFTDADIRALSQLSYREFYARYAGDQTPNVPGNYSTGTGIYVGHVGIIERDENNDIWIVEAIMGKGVIRTEYTAWLKSRPGEIVWHGRVREIDQQKRARIAIESKKYIGISYDFWNFDLNDEKGFYCSKLVWLAVSRSNDFAIDGNQNPKRKFWFSPKQLLYSKTISRLHDPGPYANL